MFLATLASGTGTWLAFVALQLDVQQRTDSGSWISLLLMAEILPAVVIGLLLGSLVDRLSRRRLMIGADLLRCAVFCALPFAPGAAAIVALAFVAGVGTGFFRPAVYAGLPNLVSDDDLPDANSLLLGVDNLTWAIAPLAGGVLVAASSPDVAYWFNAVTFLVSAALVAGIPARLLQASEAVTHGHWRDLGDGFRLVARSAALLTVLITWNVVMVTSAGINVGEVFLAKDSLGAGDAGFGLLVGAAGLGLALGSTATAGVLRRFRLPEVYGVSIALFALGTGAAAVSPGVWGAVAGVFVAGCGNGAAVVCNSLFVQRGAPDHLRGRAFTLLMSSNYVVLVAAMVIAGRLTDAVGARWVWGAAAIAAAVASVLGFALARRAVGRRPVEVAVESAA
jgi:MFS family permease